MDTDPPDLKEREPPYEDKSADFLLAEYASLRSEILNRSKAQSQIVSLAIIASGTFLAFGIQDSGTIALAYPILALFLITLWVHHDYRIRQIGSYIKERIEGYFLNKGLGWQHRYALSSAGKASVTSIASSGVIIGTQMLAVAVGGFTSSFHLQDVALLTIDVVVILVSVIAVRHRRYDFNF